MTSGDQIEANGSSTLRRYRPTPLIKSRVPVTGSGPMMTMDVAGGGGGKAGDTVTKGSGAGQPGGQTGAQECAGCCKPITERFLLKALDMFWHEDCLKCGCCDCRLGEVGSTLYTKANLILCKRDYLRLFGNTGYCAACSKVIPAFEMVMRARSNVYHLECFACQQCNHRFCVGDRFYLCENKILCEYDYEERLVFANMAYNPPSLSHLKRQTSIPPVSLPGHLLNGVTPGTAPGGGRPPPLPPSNGDMNNNMSGGGGAGPPTPGGANSQSPFGSAHKNGPPPPMQLGTATS
ncbi:unnamed protein product [Acanthoscelides obtectus]|uniref:LIM zinc-binding domain-containing protein n=1 Tax=Acanthoscelides obtectus TaxID=200917 RepID=A0A9P0LDF9_ACAOB|nr:unnamed protein product [Acanthoscelides obtectus]CAK1621820.1 Rhombotin-1 [Acanthoscelides obtectus]